MGLLSVVSVPAEYEPEGEEFIICRWCGVEWKVPVHIAQKNVARLNRALDKSFERRTNVLRFPRLHG